MKTVKIKFVGHCDGFAPDWSQIYNILVKHYDVQIVEEDPDYILCDIFDEQEFNYCQYPQVRIMECGENYIPDFNLVDYAICRYPLQLGDRNFYLPGCAIREERWLPMLEKDRNYPDDFVQNKTYFASFIASHESEYGIRGDFFRKLSQYKRVESPGTYLNNMDGSCPVRWDNDSKIQFQRKCKFSLCFESTSHDGFITEKLSDGFFSDTIPVYYGSPSAAKIFNPKAYINCHDYDSFDQVVERIKELDQDDEQYLAMMREPIFVDDTYPKRLVDDLEAFVLHIFEQPVEKAFRRSRIYYAQDHNDYVLRLTAMEKKNMMRRIRRALREIREKF